MRKKIIIELADDYGKEEYEVIDILEENIEIPPFRTRISKDRTVIDKSHIKLEEQIVLDYYKLLLNRYCNIRFPNRSYIMTELMNIMPYLHKYNAYTIYKFDFKDFFYNICPKKSFNYIYDSVSLKTSEHSFLKNYTYEIEALVPGIGLHNSLVEISGYYFDLEVKKTFKEGLLYYARYVDDCILILDEKLPEKLIEDTIIKLLKKCLGNKLKINLDKTQCIHSDSINVGVDYLGYYFEKCQSAKSQFKFGIAKKKLDKYVEQINNIVFEFKTTHDVELLSFRLDIFFKRIVYYGTRKKNKKYRWQVRGLSDSYKELKRFMKNNNDYSNITRDTTKLFGQSIELCFIKNDVIIPAKINNQLKNRKYSSSFINNRALLIHKKIGLSHSNLKKITSIVSEDNLENYNYIELANKLLSRIM
ncbi:reverse transcriptase [compost metagenome]